MTANRIVHLVLLGDRKENIPWTLGNIFNVSKSPKAIADLVRDHAATDDSDGWLFWDGDLGVPNPATILHALSLPADVLHAGLLLGLRGHPRLLDSIQPTWLFNCDPDPNNIATSWRISLRACLVRTEVLRRMGSLLPDFQNLDAAALEMGHRYLMYGVIVRHYPALLPARYPVNSVRIPFEEECLFVFHRMGRNRSYRAILQALITGHASLKDVMNAFWSLRGRRSSLKPSAFREINPSAPVDLASRVSILIPTLDRYDYLRKLLSQLRTQTIMPLEIILVDQTAEAVRDRQLANEFKDLPLKILYLDRPGQCSARNAGLKISQGEYILFLDDDDEVPPDLIDSHLKSLSQFQCPVSCGVADEVDAGALPEDFSRIRCTDVFPTNNTMIHRSALEASGLFDVAYDRDYGDDGDLGMRMYLSGILMMLNPSVRVIHHHAGSGGLRAHGARVITHAISRRRLFRRNIPSVALIYQWKRYFTPSQVRERLRIAILGTLSLYGSTSGKIFKFLVGILFLPHSLWKIRKNTQRAEQMLQRFPQIPMLEDPQTAAETA